MDAVELAQSLMAPGPAPLLGSAVKRVLVKRAQVTHQEGETAGEVSQPLVSHDVT